ncbi:hypothetical protein ACQR09_32025 [Bradyrhizobium oligotrophicum]
MPTIQDWLEADWMKSPVALTGRRAKILKKAEREAGMRAYEDWQVR